MSTTQTQLRPVPTLNLGSLWRGLMRDLFAGYRPERHYMRGPGPAWNSKNCRAKAI